MNNMSSVRTDSSYYAKYFEGRDFGTNNYAELIHEALMKVACGYVRSYTMDRILKDADLVSIDRDFKYERLTLTVHGERTLYCFYTESKARPSRVMGGIAND